MSHPGILIAILVFDWFFGIGGLAEDSAVAWHVGYGGKSLSLGLA